MKNLEGVIYVLHFDRPYEHARHYVGFCESYENLDSRFDYHANGNGSRLMAAVSDAGIGFTLVRLWRGTRNDERAIKNGSHTRKYCPECSEQPRKRRGLVELDI